MPTRPPSATRQPPKRRSKKWQPGFGPYLRRLMDRQNLTRAEFAEAAGVSDGYLHRILYTKGQPAPSDEILLRFAAALEEPADTMFFAAGVIPDDLHEAILLVPPDRLRTFVRIAKDATP